MIILLHFIEAFATYLEFWIFYGMLDYLATQKYKDEKHKLYKNILVLFLTLCTLLCNYVSLFSFITLFIAITMLTLCSGMLYKDHYLKYLYFSCVYFFVIYIMDFLMILLLSRITNNLYFGKEVIGNLSINRMIYILFLKTLLIIIYLCFKAICNKYKIKAKYFKPLFFISLIGFVGIFYLDEGTFEKISSNVISNWFRLLIMILLISFLVLLIFKVQNDSIERRAMELHSKVLESDYNNLKMLYEHDKKLFHDFNNHLNLIFHLLEKGQVEKVKEYILKMGSFSKLINNYVYSGNEIIDILLNTKTAYAKENDIDVTLNVGVNNVIAIKASDLCVIISNLYDNAIEANLKIEDKESRKIAISIGIINKMMILKFKNTYFSNATNSSQIFKTSKQDFRYHGLGLKSVETAVDKYDGYIEYNIKDAYVKITVMIPLGQTNYYP